MEQKKIMNKFGACLSRGRRKEFFWFADESQREKWRAGLDAETGAGGELEIRWVGHFDELVQSGCDFSRELHKRFFQIPESAGEFEDGKVSESCEAVFYNFLNSGDVWKRDSIPVTSAGA